jgi:serine/threonine protein kinase
MSNFPIYFIDMELCDLNLEQYNKATLTAALVNQEPLRVHEARIWDIMKQVTNGLVFMHSNDEVHRDLKPRNGSSPVTHHVANVCSSIFSQ